MPLFTSKNDVTETTAIVQPITVIKICRKKTNNVPIDRGS